MPVISGEQTEAAAAAGGSVMACGGKGEGRKKAEHGEMALVKSVACAKGDKTINSMACNSCIPAAGVGGNAVAPAHGSIACNVSL